MAETTTKAKPEEREKTDDTAKAETSGEVVVPSNVIDGLFEKNKRKKRPPNRAKQSRTLPARQLPNRA